MEASNVEGCAVRAAAAGAMAGGGERLMPCARAKFGFQANSAVELSFSAGVSVRLLRRIDENWLEGELAGKVGIFPASYVDIELGKPSKARERELARSGRPYAIGLFEFAEDCQGDLPFAKGELIELLGPAGSGWLRGRTARGGGIFPASFVEILKLPVPPAEPSTASHSPPRDSRRSPEYAEPSPLPGRGLASPGELAREPAVPLDAAGEEAVFENGFSDEEREEEEEEEEEARPVPVPRRKQKSKSLSSSVLLGEGRGGGEGRTVLSLTPPVSPLPPGTSPPPRREVSSSSVTKKRQFLRYL